MRNWMNFVLVIFRLVGGLMSELELHCPVCGAWATEETLVTRCEIVFKQTEFGQGLFWREIHCCDCGHVWSFNNSNL